jgi:hypothetical protein
MRSRCVALCFAILLPAAFLAFSPRPTRDASEGVVEADGQPLAGATVRGQGEAAQTRADARGRFRLPRPTAEKLTASAPGHRIGWIETHAASRRIPLTRLPAEDNVDYDWIEPHPDPAQPGNCAHCHAEIYREWAGSAHAQSTGNPKFLSFHGGDRKRKSWNVTSEHPLGAGVCAACHVPTLSSSTLDYDPREAKGAAASGVHCDYCHKVADAPIDKLGIRFGRDGLELLRPAKGDLISYGPLDDAVRPGESFAHLPLYKESRYCASCHEGTVFGVHAYGTYSEWLASPARLQGRQCQDCHMAPTGLMTNIALGHGGVERDPRTLASHHVPGATHDMLRRALKLTVKSEPLDDGWRIETTIDPHEVGHRVPTGFIDRHLVLRVQAWDAKGDLVALSQGSKLPASARPWQGQAGFLYARRLVGADGRTPIPFWLPVAEIVDTRLFPGRIDCQTFVFPATAQRVEVQLWHRRFWQEVADERGWTDHETLVALKKLDR